MVLKMVKVGGKVVKVHSVISTREIILLIKNVAMVFSNGQVEIVTKASTMMMNVRATVK